VAARAAIGGCVGRLVGLPNAARVHRENINQTRNMSQVLCACGAHRKAAGFRSEAIYGYYYYLRGAKGERAAAATASSLRVFEAARGVESTRNGGGGNGGGVGEEYYTYDERAGGTVYAAVDDVMLSWLPCLAVLLWCVWKIVETIIIIMFAVGPSCSSRSAGRDNRLTDST